MPRPRPPFLHREVSRHGRTTWYVRRQHGPRIRLSAEYGSPEFWREYRDAVAGTATERSNTLKGGTLAWGIEKYRQSAAWAQLATATRRQRENIYREVISSAGSERLADIDAGVIRDGRDRRAAAPHAANNWLKALRGACGWWLEYDFIDNDPTKGVKLLRGENDKVGYHTWTEDELSRFEARWPLGTRERLAFDVLLYTGLRRGDAVRLGRQHIRGDTIYFPRTEKTGEDVTLPLLQPLATSISATKTGDLTFIVTERGLPFVKESFGNWFSETCRKSGVPGSAHGLRKSGATRAADNGASERQLMALFGWRDPKMAAHYTRAADKRRLAMAAGKLLIAQKQNETARTHESGAGENEEPLKKTGG